MDALNNNVCGVQIVSHHHHQHIQQTSKNLSETIDGEMLDKINQLTTKPDSVFGGNNAKVPTIKDFVIIKPISRGAFGKVFLGFKNTDPSKLFAIKVMRKSEMINKNMVSQVITERNALALSRSPFCVSLFYSLQSTSYVYLVMDYMIGGDLKSLLAIYGYFDESAARFYVAEVALALQYLHNHGIVHRDIKPDNMLLSATGHIKLTDFGLSKIEMSRVDLEISDLLSNSPNLNYRTPGQLLSLTSHLSFGSEKKLEYGTGVSNFLNIINKHGCTIESSDSEADTSLNDAEKTSDSKISGISPFFSAEEVNGSLIQFRRNARFGNFLDSGGSSYHTCDSIDGSKLSPSLYENMELLTNKKNGYGNIDDIPSNLRSYKRSISSSKTQEDSGVSCRKSDYSSSQLNSELSSSTLDKVDFMCSSKNDTTCSDYSKSFNNYNHTSEMNGSRNSSSGKLTRNFKQPETLSNSMRGLKRKINLIRRSDKSSGLDGITNSSSTGLTQEIDIMGLGSSTPKKRKAKSPIQGAFKIRSISDDETPQVIITTDATNVVFSTPVSSQKLFKRDQGLGLAKLKTTRFNLPLGIENNNKCVPNEQPIENSCTSSIKYLKMPYEDPAMSPINLDTNLIMKTPRNVNTPFRTPKSVRRGLQKHSNEKILGTPDYLAPELLTRQGHGPPVDWWALGVCFYEFLTGIPPFNDETPQKVFDNILNKNIEWPEGEEALSDEAIRAVDLMLTMNPTERPAALEVREMPFFTVIQWDNIEKEVPPFVPSPDDPTDTGYFAARNNLQHLKLSNFVFED